MTGSEHTGGKAVFRRLAGLRAAAVIFLFLALAGVTLPVPSRRHQLVILLDVSASVDRVEQERARRAALAVMEGLAPSDRVAVVTFAGGRRVVVPPAPPKEAAAVLAGTSLSAPEPEKTDLRAALGLGADILREGSGTQGILLFSDGRSNAGGDAGSFAAMDLKAIRIYTVPVGLPAGGIYTLGLELPEISRPGERILAGWKVSSDRRQNVTVTMRVNGRVAAVRQEVIPAGNSTLPLPLSVPEEDLVHLELEVAGEDGRPAPQAEAAGLLRVSAPSRVLVVAGDPPSPLTAALKAQGMPVREDGVEAFPGTALELASYAAVVLDNVPAYAVAENRQQALQDYVSRGGGLLVVGGEKSLGRGEYYASRLEEMLPVKTDTRQRLLFDRLKMLFVIDQSGSMTETVGGVSKQQAAIQGLLAAAVELSPWDEVGVIGFTDKAHWLLPFTPAADYEEIRKAAERIKAGGGTDLAAGLEAAIHSFTGSEPVRRHVVVISDGLTITADFADLCRRLQEMRITITTIGVGDEIDEPLLRDIARRGEGEFYRVNQEQVPRVIVAETFRVTRELIQEGRFIPVVRTPADFLGGLPDSLPPALGYLTTRPKPTAEVYLEVGEGDPFLAAWRYGNGLVMVLTADSGRRWLAPWITSRFYNRFFGQLLRAVERRTPDEGLRVFAGLEAGTARLVVEAAGPDRRLRPGLQLLARSSRGDIFRLRETASGRYEGIIPLDNPGLHLFEVYEKNTDSWNTGWVFNPPGLEDRLTGPDTSFLSYLSALSGGRVLSPDGLKPPAPEWLWTPAPLRSVLIFLALLLFVLELVYRSTFLGQAANALAAVLAWWSRQQKLIREMTRWKTEETIPHRSSSYVPEVNTYYRYLARRRKHLEKDKED